jgi:hypothetical protein
MRLCSWFAGIDLDSRYVTAVLGCSTDDGPPRVLGCKAVDVGTTFARQGNAESPMLREAVARFTEWFHLESGGALASIALAVPGSAMQEMPSSAVVELGAREVVDAAAFDQACRSALAGPGQLGPVLASVQRGVVLDGRPQSRPPLGQVGSSLRVELTSWIGRRDVLAPVIEVLERNEFAIDQMVPRVAAAGRAILTDIEQRDGALVVLIGEESTDVAIFAGFELVDLLTVSLGRKRLVAELARECRVSIDAVDRLDLDLMISRMPSDPLVQRVRTALSAWGTALFSTIRNRMHGLGLAPRLDAGIVIANSPQLFPTLDQTAARLLGIPARFAAVDAQFGKPAGAAGSFAALGLIPLQWNARITRETTADIRLPEYLRPRPGRAPHSTGRGTIGQALSRWLREFVPVEHG